MSQESFLRVSDIIGSPKRGVPAILPVSRSHFWRLVQSGLIPKPTKLGPRISLWRKSDIEAVLRQISKAA